MRELIQIQCMTQYSGLSKHRTILCNEEEMPQGRVSRASKYIHLNRKNSLVIRYCQLLWNKFGDNAAEFCILGIVVCVLNYLGLKWCSGDSGIDARFYVHPLCLLYGFSVIIPWFFNRLPLQTVYLARLSLV